MSRACSKSRNLACDYYSELRHIRRSLAFLAIGRFVVDNDSVMMITTTATTGADSAAANGITVMRNGPCAATGALQLDCSPSTRTHTINSKKKTKGLPQIRDLGEEDPDLLCFLCDPCLPSFSKISFQLTSEQK